MKYRIVKAKSGYDIIQDPDGKAKKLGNAKDQVSALNKLDNLLKSNK